MPSTRRLPLPGVALVLKVHFEALDLVKMASDAGYTVTIPPLEAGSWDLPNVQGFWKMATALGLTQPKRSF